LSEECAAQKRFTRRGIIFDKKSTSNNTSKHESVMDPKTAAGLIFFMFSTVFLNAGLKFVDVYRNLKIFITILFAQLVW